MSSKPLISSMAVTLFILFACPGIIFAQDAGTPATAGEGLNSLAVFLAALAGLASTAIVDALKNIPWLKTGEKSRIAGPLGDLVAAVVSIATGYAILALTPVAGFLDQSGFWQVIIFAWPFAKSWFEAKQLRKSIAMGLATRR